MTDPALDMSIEAMGDDEEDTEPLPSMELDTMYEQAREFRAWNRDRLEAPKAARRERMRERRRRERVIEPKE